MFFYDLSLPLHNKHRVSFKINIKRDGITPKVISSKCLFYLRRFQLRGSNWQNFKTGSSNGFTENSRQAVTWPNVESVSRRHVALLWNNELTHWGRDKCLPFRRRQFEMHFLERKCIKFHFTFVPKGPINNIPALVQNRRQTIIWANNIRLPTHICGTRPQWIKNRSVDDLVKMQIWITLSLFKRLMIILIDQINFNHLYIDGLVQNCTICSALAMEILQSCTNQSIWYATFSSINLRDVE